MSTEPPARLNRVTPSRATNEVHPILRPSFQYALLAYWLPIWAILEFDSKSEHPYGLEVYFRSRETRKALWPMWAIGYVLALLASMDMLNVFPDDSTHGSY